MKTIPTLIGTLLATVALCGTTIAHAGPVLNGPTLNGPILQGPLLQGPLLQGPLLQGPLLQGPLIQGPQLTSLNSTVTHQPVAIRLADGRLIPLR